jgi:RimJ/RimL family protein N-acetyltransferase
MFLMDADPRVLATLFGCTPPSTVEDSSRGIAMVRKQYVENGIGRWAVIEKDSGLFIGWAGLKIESNVNGHESFYDLGYRFIPEFW